jgi:hypothetical protein
MIAISADPENQVRLVFLSKKIFEVNTPSSAVKQNFTDKK